MKASLLSALAPYIALVVTVFFFVLSVIDRRAAGLPMIDRAPRNALYVDEWASAGIAKHCLLVAITSDVLSVVPKFPFNLGFAELELTIPVSEIHEAKRLRGLSFGKNVAVAYGNNQLRLNVSNPSAFLDALATCSVPVSS